MNRGTLIRILEAFFKRWYLYVLPLVVMIVLGLSASTQTTAQYTSRGSMFVESGNLVTSLSNVPETGLASFLTPAQFASQEISGLVQTDVFVDSVLATAGADNGATQFFWGDPVTEARASTTALATSENLVQVSASTPDPELSRRLVTATIDAFIEFKIGLALDESAASEELFTELAENYQRIATDAEAAVDDFLADIPDEEAMLPTQTAELARLTEAETEARASYREALNAVEASLQGARQAETEVRASIFVLDPATLPTSSDSSLLTSIITFATYVIIGLMLMLAGPVVAAMANRSVLFPEDLDHIDGVSVLSVVPRGSRGQMKLKKATAPTATDSALLSLTTVDQLADNEPTIKPRVEFERASFGTSSTGLNRIVPSTLSAPAESGTGGDTTPDPRRANG